jgi:hypothetical protein
MFHPRYQRAAVPDLLRLVGDGYAFDLGVVPWRVGVGQCVVPSCLVY